MEGGERGEVTPHLLGGDEGLGGGSSRADASGGGGGERGGGGEEQQQQQQQLTEMRTTGQRQVKKPPLGLVGESGR